MRILRKITDEFWLDVAHKCDYATFYHTPIWREIADRIFPGRYQDQTFGAILPNGVRVVFPLVSKKRLGSFRWLDSSPIGGYGGVIADGPLHPTEMQQLYKRACTWSTASLYVVDNPLRPQLPDTLTSQFRPVVNDTAHSVPLDADFDTVFSRFQRTQRKDYRRGFKRGVQVRLAESLADYQEHYQIYRDAVDRWGEDESYGYTWEQWKQIYQLSLIYPKNIKLWLMIVNDQIVGGTITFYWGTHATAWNGTAHRDFLDYDVMPVGDTEMIRDAIESGYQHFDFNTSNQKRGLIEYKQRFGSVATPIRGWLYENPVVTSARAIYQQLRSQNILSNGLASGFAVAALQGL